MEGEHIKGSPFTVTMKLPVQKLGTPSKTIRGVNKPWGVAVNQRGDIIVAESSGCCVSIFSPAGEKVQSFGSKGLSHGQFINPRGVAVDSEDNILVVDYIHVQKFTSNGQIITAVGKKGDKHLEFYDSYGIGIHPHFRKVYVADTSNHRIQILNPDLTFSSSFGGDGEDNGQFNRPYDVAFDSTGNVYVVDFGNHCIQVFTAAGQFMRKFGTKGKGNGDLYFPIGISIDTDDVVYVTEFQNNRVSVFTCDGNFLFSFGPGQLGSPRGIAVDKNGVVYISDYGHHHINLYC